LAEKANHSFSYVIPVESFEKMYPKVEKAYHGVSNEINKMINDLETKLRERTEQRDNALDVASKINEKCGDLRKEKEKLGIEYLNQGVIFARERQELEHRINVSQENFNKQVQLTDKLHTDNKSQGEAISTLTRRIVDIKKAGSDFYELVRRQRIDTSAEITALKKVIEDLKSTNIRLEDEIERQQKQKHAFKLVVDSRVGASVSSVCLIDPNRIINGGRYNG
jgi:DNA repair exonuclease SbcCD ATPase subunit